MMAAKTINVVELQSLREQGTGFQLIDVRSPSEFAAGHIPGAINVPLDETESRLDDYANVETILVCQSGKRATMACEFLHEHRPDARVLEGGTSAWISAGLQTVTSRKTRWSMERQTRLGAGLLVLTGALLGFAVAPGWFGLCAFVGAGLTFAGATDICPMGIILSAMPWNKARLNCNARKETVQA